MGPGLRAPPAPAAWASQRRRVYRLKDRGDAFDDTMREAFWNAARWHDENAANHVNHEIYPNQYWPTVKQAGVVVIGPSTDPELHRSQPGDPELAEGQVAEEVGQRAIDLALGKPA